MMHFNKKPVVLDVTIRDGGYLNDWHFEQEEIIRVFSKLSEIGIDIIEVGYLHSDMRKPPALRCDADYLKLVKSNIRPETKIAVMLRSDDEYYLEALEKTAPYIDLIRLACTEDAFDEELDMAVNVRKHGITCSINFTSITSFTDAEILHMLDKVKARDCADLLYIADSRGTLQPAETYRLYSLLRRSWDKYLGFHGHNNQGLAIANVKAAREAGVDCIDASIKGYSLGGGNTGLSELLQLLAAQRPDIQKDKINLDELIYLDNTPEYAHLFPLSGKKNLEQAWVAMIWEKYGEKSVAYLEQLPDGQLNKALTAINL